MPITLILAILLQLPDDAPVPEPTPCKFQAALVLPVPGAEYLVAHCEDGQEAYLYLWYRRGIVHADDPTRQPVPFVAIANRFIRHCDAHGEVEVMGGMPPQDFAFASSVEGWVDADRPPGKPSYEDTLVTKGLASRSAVTREAASRILTAHGVASIVALHRGLESKDAEVRLRCELILSEVRNGPLE